MKFLIVGGGSMGKRRIRCLLANDVDVTNIRLVDSRDDRRQQCHDEYGVDGLPDLTTGLDWDPDALIVSVPGGYHMDVCTAAAERGKHFFVEVPLTLKLDGIDNLCELVERHNLIAAPGCQQPFHPLNQQLKTWLHDPAFGNVLVFSQQFGQYLPDWHPYEDYRSFYASKQELGGCNLDVINQETITWQWALGDQIAELSCHGSHLSELEIDGCDYWQIMGRTAGGTAVSARYDMLQRKAEYVSRFISENGTIVLDKLSGKIERYLASTGEWETVTPPDGFNYEQCYFDEIASFINCINGTDQWFNPLPNAIHSVRMLLAMQESARTHQWVSIA